MNELSALIQGPREIFLAPSAMLTSLPHSNTIGLQSSFWRWIFTRTWLCWHPELKLPASETERNKFLGFISHLVCSIFFFLQQPKWTMSTSLQTLWKKFLKGVKLTKIHIELDEGLNYHRGKKENKVQKRHQAQMYSQMNSNKPLRVNNHNSTLILLHYKSNTISKFILLGVYTSDFSNLLKIRGAKKKTIAQSHLWLLI